MRFPGGPVPLDMPLTCSGRTGIGGPVVREPERPPALSSIPTRRLELLHDELGVLAALEPEGPLRDYMMLIEMQAGAELVKRLNR